MINLSDVSTYKLIASLKQDKSNKKICSKLLKYSVKDYQQLKDLIISKKREFNDEFFVQSLACVEENVKHANENGREPVLFICDDYKDAAVDEKTLEITDSSNPCSVLLCKSPAIFGLGKYGVLKDINISDAKHLLSKVNAYSKVSTGNNSFIENIGRFNNLEAENIKNAINFYEQQVIRQAMETKKKRVNLFALNKSKKEKIVILELKQIIEYFVYNADMCVWGELSSSQKIRLISSVSCDKGQENQVIRKRMIDIITNYTTLSELEAGVVKQKTLDRFIIK